MAGAGNGPNLTDHRGFHALADIIARLEPRFQRYVEVRDLAFDLVSGGDHGRLGDVINSTQDAIVAVGCLQSAVAGHVRPVAPVATVPILTIPRVVLVDVAIWVLPDRLKRARPGVLNTDISSPAGAWRNLVAYPVIDDRMNARHARSCTSRLHRVQGWHRAAQEPPVFGLPPSVDDGPLTLAHHVVVPAPHRRLDGFAHRGHMLEVVIVFCRLLGTGTPQRAYRRWRGVKDIDVELFGDAPRTPGVGIGGKPLEHNRGGSERQGPVNDVGMTGNPADVGHTPVDVLRVNVLNVLRRPGYVGEISARAMLTTFRPPSGAAGIHEEQGVLGRHLHRVNVPAAEHRQHLVHHEIATFDQRRFARMPARIPLPDEHLLGRYTLLLGFVESDVRFLFVIEQLSAAVIRVHRDQDAAFGIDDTVSCGFATEAAEDLRMNNAEPCTG